MRRIFKKITKKNLLRGFILICVALIVFFLLSYGVKDFLNSSYFQKADSYKDKIVFFYGDGCKHCVKVDNFIDANKVQDKVQFIRLEVFNNPSNASLLSDKAQICGLDSSKIGVPFLWDGYNEKCVIGYADVISFFQNKIGQKKP